MTVTTQTSRILTARYPPVGPRRPWGRIRGYIEACQPLEVVVYPTGYSLARWQRKDCADPCGHPGLALPYRPEGQCRRLQSWASVRWASCLVDLCEQVLDRVDALVDADGEPMLLRGDLRRDPLAIDVHLDEVDVPGRDDK